MFALLSDTILFDHVVSLLSTSIFSAGKMESSSIDISRHNDTSVAHIASF